MEYPKVVKISAPPLRKLIINSEIQGSNRANAVELKSQVDNEVVFEEKQLPPSPIPALLSPKDSINGLFQKTWREIESACEFEKAPAMEFALAAPLIEGELLVLEKNKDLVKRWCVIKNNVFTIYRSFKHRSALIDINLNGEVKVVSAQESQDNGLHGFRIFAGARYLECYSTSAVTAQAWSVTLCPSSSPKASSTHLSHYSSFSFSPSSPKPQALSITSINLTPENSLDITAPETGNPALSLVIPERKNIHAIIMHSAPSKASLSTGSTISSASKESAATDKSIHSAPERAHSNNILAGIDSKELFAADTSLHIMHSAPLKPSSSNALSAIDSKGSSISEKSINSAPERAHSNNIFAGIDSNGLSVPLKNMPIIMRSAPEKSPVVDINGLSVAVPTRNQSLYSPKKVNRQV